VDPVTGTIDIPGLDNPASQKWRNVERNANVSLVVDDVVLDPWSPRAIEIRGIAEALPDVSPPGRPWAKPGVIRIHPRRIIAMGIETDGPGTRTVPA
ncbi:MAG: PPOX class F420-dependent oxidoreductase, partial [Actinomycetes bacterium]